jgi:hypothetical protein
MSASSSAQPQSEQEVTVGPIVDIEASTPGVFKKDKMDFFISELFCYIEKTVDFESLRVNGMGDVKELLEIQRLNFFFDILNGLVYPTLIKDFWMNAESITQGTFDKIQADNDNSDKNRFPEYLGHRSEVGVCIRIRAEHIRQALKLPSKGLYLRSDEKEMNTFMQEKIYGKGYKSKSNQSMKPLYKVLYKILHESIIPKVGFTESISKLQGYSVLYRTEGSY